MFTNFSADITSERGKNSIELTARSVSQAAKIAREWYKEEKLSTWVLSLWKQEKSGEWVEIPKEKYNDFFFSL